MHKRRPRRSRLWLCLGRPRDIGHLRDAIRAARTRDACRTLSRLGYDYAALGAARADARDADGLTCLMRAARRGCANVLKALVDSPLVTSESLDAPNDKLQFPLHFAAFKRNPEAVDVLLAAGASPNVVDRKGRRPDEDTDVLEIQQKIKAARESYA